MLVIALEWVLFFVAFWEIHIYRSIVGCFPAGQSFFTDGYCIRFPEHLFKLSAQYIICMFILRFLSYAQQSNLLFMFIWNNIWFGNSPNNINHVKNLTDICASAFLPTSFCDRFDIASETSEYFPSKRLITIPNFISLILHLSKCLVQPFWFNTEHDAWWSVHNIKYGYFRYGPSTRTAHTTAKHFLRIVS